MLDDTLVLVTSEFGRTPVLNLGGFRSVHNGRDHNIYGFTVLMAGGGSKAGSIYGATEDFGFKVAENPVHVHDLHATVLHLLGLNHEKLTFKYSGRNFRLTDVAGRVVKELMVLYQKDRERQRPGHVPAAGGADPSTYGIDATGNFTFTTHVDTA